MIVERFIRWCLNHRTHQHHLADYMLRYWLFFPRNKNRINFRLHHILRSDHDRHMHNHPWWFISIILKGGYFEDRLIRHIDYDTIIRKYYGPGSILFRKANDFHKLTLAKTAWTFVITGPKRSEWGFQTDRGFIDWREYLVMTGQTALIEDEDLNG